MDQISFFTHGEIKDDVVQLEIINCMRSDELTNVEIARRIGWPTNRITPGIEALREAGRLEAVGRCKEAGKLVVIWRKR